MSKKPISEEDEDGYDVDSANLAKEILKVISRKDADTALKSLFICVTYLSLAKPDPREFLRECFNIISKEVLKNE